MRLNIGFVSTRFAGTDGVSLEASKWADVLEELGHRCFWFAGKLSKSSHVSFQAGQAHFKHPGNQFINSQLSGSQKKSPQLARTINDMKSGLAEQLKLFINGYGIDLLVVQNALAIPMQIPLGLALTDVLEETGMPAIAHHHDFYWERKRYLPLNGNKIYIQRAFPPRLPNIEHVVINSRARTALARRRGIDATVIPNVLDFENPPWADEERISACRQAIGLNPDDTMVLQPTRIVERKGIESAIYLLRELNQPGCKLVVSHAAGDEGFEYANRINRLAKKSRIDIRYIHHMVTDPYGPGRNLENRFSLWEVYQAADFVTYPSLYEGFGNALLEAVYFKKPLLVNRYKIFKDDIEPKGFNLVKMDGRLNASVVADIKSILDDPWRWEKMAAENYRIARRHYSYKLLRRQLTSLISGLFSRDCHPHQPCYRKAAG